MVQLKEIVVSSKEGILKSSVHKEIKISINKNI